MIVGIVLIEEVGLYETPFFNFSSYETCCCTNVYVKNNLSDMNLKLLIEVLWSNLSLFVK